MRGPEITDDMKVDELYVVQWPEKGSKSLFVVTLTKDRCWLPLAGPFVGRGREDRADTALSLLSATPGEKE